jgi:hypothetical protein
MQGLSFICDLYCTLSVDTINSHCVETYQSMSMIREQRKKLEHCSVNLEIDHDLMIMTVYSIARCSSEVRRVTYKLCSFSF